MKNIIYCLAAILMAVSAVAETSIQDVQVIRPDLAKLEDDQLVLKGEPEGAKVLSPPAVLLNIDGWPEGDEPAGIEMQILPSMTSKLELQGILPSGRPIVFDTRVATGSDRIVRWQLDPKDRVTSFTLAVRTWNSQGQVKILTATARSFSELSIQDRLEAYNQNPAWITSAAEPIENGVLRLEMTAPPDLREELESANILVQVNARGTIASEEVNLDFNKDGFATLEVPVGEHDPDKFTAWIHMEEPGKRTSLARVDVKKPTLATPHFEVPSRSIESLAVIERNGELAFYTVVTKKGVAREAVDIPLIGDSVRLAVGNGERWVVDEELMKSRRDSEWLGGGPLAFSIGTHNDNSYGYFTVAFPSGPEALGVAYGKNSLRIAASAKNPVWMPDVETTETAAIWRGNGFLVFNDATMLAGLEKYAGQPARVRLLSSPNQIEWSDLGLLDLPDFDGNNLSLATFQTDGVSYILATPVRQLYRAKETPLRGWEQVPIEMPETWREPSITMWTGQLWMFALQECNGRGVVVWAPMLKEGNGFRALSEYGFKPAPLNDTIPTPAGRRSE